MTYERNNILLMEGYVPGEQPLDPATIKLNTNENPYPATPAVNAVLQGISAPDLRRYPPPTAIAFREAAARLHGLTAEQVIATRGGDELLRLVLTTFVAPGDTIVVTDPTYSLYPVLAQIQDCRVKSIALEEDWCLPDGVAATANAAGAVLTLLVNPHAPSGHLCSYDTIRDIAGALDGLLLVDEAYVDFVDPDLGYSVINLVNDLPNVIILRTLSKGYSLAGLRFGYGLGAPELVAPMLYKTRDSYNLDYISQQVAVAAILDQDYARTTWARVRSERNRLATNLADLGIAVSPSQTNFLLARIGPNAKDVYEGLKTAGILVRHFDAHRLDDKLRITVGTPAENAALVVALSRLV
ncbi:MAG: histidinol-phosphate transaminase [Pseudomonadota bacterium]